MMKAVFKGILYRVVKACQHREHVEQDQGVYNHRCGDDYAQDGHKGSGGILEDQQIQNKYDAEEQQDQPDDRCLLEILLEGFQEAPGDIAFFIFGQL